jgi:hypothetical protein
MIEIMAVCLLGIMLSLGVLLVAVAKEYPKRKDKHKRGGQSSQAIRDRHLEVIRSNEQPVIEPTQIIV